MAATDSACDLARWLLTLVDDRSDPEMCQHRPHDVNNSYNSLEARAHYRNI